MAELHPNYLDSVRLNTGDQSTGSHKQLPEIFDIVDWLQHIYGHNLLLKAKAHITNL